MYKFIFGLLFALNCCTASFAATTTNLPVSIVQETEQYNTIDEAAVAALTIAMPLSETANQEFGGIIIQLNDKFMFTSAVTTSESTALNFAARFPHGAKFIGLYHTHPGNFDCSNYFSAPDVEIAQKFDITSYIGVTGSNTIRRFIPNKTPTYQPILAMHERISDGVVISSTQRT